MRNRQLSLFPPQATTHGGMASKGKRKSARPFDRKKAIHVTLRASRATRDWSMLARKHKGYVYLEGDRIARESQVKLYRFVTWAIISTSSSKRKAEEIFSDFSACSRVKLQCSSRVQRKASRSSKDSGTCSRTHGSSSGAANSQISLAIWKKTSARRKNWEHF
jgi:hypothetical protein